MKKTINSYNLMQGKIETYNWNDYCKDVVVLDHHYMSDVVFLEKIRKNAKKLGYQYERNLNTLDFEPENRGRKIPPRYEKLTIFTKVDTEKVEEFPEEKIAIYRAYTYWAEQRYYIDRSCGNYYYSIRQSFNNGVSIEELYKDYIKLFCGAEGFEYNRIYSFNTINTILILILDNIDDIPETFFPLRHKNYVLFSLISTSSSHEIFIAPDLRANKDSDYQKKIEELKFLLEIDDNQALSK